MTKRLICLLISCLLLLGCTALAAAEENIVLQNVVLGEDDCLYIPVYLSQAGNLLPNEFNVVVQKETIPVQEVLSFGSAPVQTDWLIVLDVAMTSRFEESKDTLEYLLDSLPAGDRAMVVTAKHDIALNWNENPKALKGTVGDIRNDSDANTLYSTISKAVAALAQGADSGRRSCIVVFSGGETASETGKLHSDLVKEIETSLIPVYVYAMKDTGPKEKTLAEYSRLAEASQGGMVFSFDKAASTERDKGENGKMLIQSQENVRVLKIAKSQLPEQMDSVTVTYNNGKTILTDGFVIGKNQQAAIGEWRNTVSITPQPSIAPTPAPTSPPTTEPTNKPVSDDFLEKYLIYILGGVLVALILVLVLVMVKGKKSAHKEEAPENPPSENKYEDENKTEIADAENKQLVIKLIRTDSGRVYSYIMKNSFVFGREEGKADMVIAGDEKISRVHGKLYVSNGMMMLANMGTNGTYVNGKKITGPTVIHQQDVLKIGAGYYQITWGLQ